MLIRMLHRCQCLPFFFMFQSFFWLPEHLVADFTDHQHETQRHSLLTIQVYDVWGEDKRHIKLVAPKYPTICGVQPPLTKQRCKPFYWLCFGCLHDLPNKSLSSMKWRAPCLQVYPFKAGMFSTKPKVLPHMDLRRRSPRFCRPRACVVPPRGPWCHRWWSLPICGRLELWTVKLWNPAVQLVKSVNQNLF